MESQLVSLSRELSELSASVSPSVVAVEGRRRMFSSGVHWRKNLIVTAEHTIRRDENIKIVLPDQKEVSAKLVGRDPGTDIALLQIENLGTPVITSELPKDIHVGEITLIVARSPNSGPNVSMGIIGAVSGPWRTWRGGNLDKYIRLDATIFPGASGGVVVNYEGKTIGIATSALSRVAGLAIPAASVEKVVDALLKHGMVPQGFIGVGLQQVLLPESFQKTLSLKTQYGLMVFSVEESGPAAKGGILVGDILLELDGKIISSIEDLQSMLTQETIGKSMELKTIRGGEIKKTPVKIGERTRG